MRTKLIVLLVALCANFWFRMGSCRLMLATAGTSGSNGPSLLQSSPMKMLGNTSKTAAAPACACPDCTSTLIKVDDNGRVELTVPLDWRIQENVTLTVMTTDDNGSYISRPVSVWVEADGTYSQVDIVNSFYLSGCLAATVDWRRHPLACSYALHKCNSLRVKIICAGVGDCPVSYKVEPQMPHCLQTRWGMEFPDSPDLSSSVAPAACATCPGCETTTLNDGQVLLRTIYESPNFNYMVQPMDNTKYAVHLLVMKQSTWQPFYLAGTTSGCVTEHVNVSSTLYNLTDPASASSSTCPKLAFALECINPGGTCDLKFSYMTGQDCSAVPSTTTSTNSISPSSSSYSSPEALSTIHGSQATDGAAYAKPDTSSTLQLGQAEIENPPSSTDVDSLDAQLAYYFASIGKTGNFNTTKQQCLAQPFISGNLTLASDLPAACEALRTCLSSYRVWMYRGAACNLALLYTTGGSGCLGGVGTVTWNSDGTWSSLGVFPNATTEVASFYATRKIIAHDPSDVSVEINGGCQAKYTASTGLTCTNSASGLSCGMLGLSALAALLIALIM